MAKLVIHAGTGKTGTSSVQVSLLKNKEALGSQGITFLESILSKPGKSAKHGLEWQKLFGRERRNLRKEAKRLAETDLTVVISNEALWKKSPRQLRVLKGLFKGFEFEVVIYVREQVEFLESRTLQSLKKGRKVLDLDFSDMGNPGGLDEFLDQFLPHLDYLETCQRIEEVFGKDSVHARLYSRELFTDGNVVSDFLEVLGADLQSLDLSTETNPSLSVPFAIITTNHREYFSPVPSRSEVLDAGLRLSKKQKAQVPRLISSKKAEEIRSRFSNSNEDFFASYVKNADGFSCKDWSGKSARELGEFVDQMSELIEEWPLMQFNGFGPKKTNRAVFCEGWDIEDEAGVFRVSRAGEESKIRFRIHLRARSRSKNRGLKLWMETTEPSAVQRVRVGNGEIEDIDLSRSPISIPTSELGEFDNVEVVFLKSDGSQAPLSVTGVRLDEDGVKEEAPVQ